VITNVVDARWIYGSAPGSASAQHQLTIPPYAVGADLALTKVGPAQASAGAEIVWKLVVRNAGGTPASGVQLTDLVPPQVTQLAAACSVLSGSACGAVGIGTPTASGTPVTVAIPSLAAGGQVEVTVRGTVTAGSGTLSNQASVGIPGAIDPTPADNTAQATTQLVPSTSQFASLRGIVWLDVDHDRMRSAGEPLLAGYTVRLYAPGGATVVAQAKTDASGAYAFGRLPAGVTYELEFRDPSGAIVYGMPVAADGSGTRFAATVACGPGNVGQAVRRAVVAASRRHLLQPDRGRLERRSGPHGPHPHHPAGRRHAGRAEPAARPSGVVYDAVTRQPIAGAAVALLGPAGFDPAQHLLGGSANAQQVTDAGGTYQFVLLAGAPAGLYRLKVEPPAQYSRAVETAAPVPTLDPSGLGSNGVYLVQPQPTPPAAGAATDLPLGARPGPGDPQVLNNHLPVDPASASGLLTLTKSAGRAVAAVGDPVQYRVRVSNTGTTALTQIEVADRLPPGFSYSSGSLRIDDAQAPDPPRSADGRTLSIPLPQLAAGKTADIRYVATIGSGAAAGRR